MCSQEKKEYKKEDRLVYHYPRKMLHQTRVITACRSLSSMHEDTTEL